MRNIDFETSNATHNIINYTYRVAHLRGTEDTNELDFFSSDNILHLHILILILQNECYGEIVTQYFWKIFNLIR